MGSMGVEGELLLHWIPPVLTLTDSRETCLFEQVIQTKREAARDNLFLFVNHIYHDTGIEYIFLVVEGTGYE